jgi:phage terminase small subunit
MARGRFPQPDALKGARGNPGKRKLKKDAPAEALALDDGGAPAASGEVLRPSSIEPPAFLTQPDEIAIFRKIVGEFLPANIARETDFGAYGRYSVYLAKWCRAKASLELPDAGDGWYRVESKHGSRLARHPASQDLLDFGTELSRLELQLGLTPLSRQSILRGLGALNGLGDLFPGARKPAEAQQNSETASASPAASPVTPLGFLHSAPPSKN